MEAILKLKESLNHYSIQLRILFLVHLIFFLLLPYFGLVEPLNSTLLLKGSKNLLSSCTDHSFWNVFIQLVLILLILLSFFKWLNII